ncbi:DNA topoisomerase like-protein [Anopheles sinensis]|uniref:DNA topoisomerase like-protein n=1 Tax=Anopheles sinensis TaxID=74873 RepID=A0A084W7J7_ANOSI|nr:DNA topoisomerase like-protein [Anopheles sinensis]
MVRSSGFASFDMDRALRCEKGLALQALYGKDDDDDDPPENLCDGRPHEHLHRLASMHPSDPTTDILRL